MSAIPRGEMGSSQRSPAQRLALVVAALALLVGGAAQDAAAQPVPGGVGGEAFWVKANQGVQANGANQVEQWLDQSGSGNTLTELRAAAPAHTNAIVTSNDILLAPVGINFNPSVNFSGAPGRSLKGNAASNWNGQPTSVFAVSVMNAPSSGPGSIAAVWSSLANWTTGAVGTAGRGLAAVTAYALDGNGCNPGSSTSSVTQPRVVRGIYTAPTSGAGGSVWVDGAQEGTGAACATAATTLFELGGRTAGDALYDTRIFKGQIAEVIVYKSVLAAADAEKVDSYLALKYGITLRHSYAASDGSVYWNMAANSTYHHDVAGIGRDDTSGLLQKQSASVNAGNFLTIGHGVIAVDNVSNPNGFAADLTSFTWGHNNASPSAVNTVDKPALFGARLQRAWKASNVGSIGNLVVQFTLPAGLFNSGNPADYALLVSNTPSFAGATAITGALSGSTLTFSNVTIADAQYFTLAVPLLPAACNLAQNGSFETPNIQTQSGPNTFYSNGYAVFRSGSFSIDGWQTASGTVDILRYYNNASEGSQSIDLWGTAPATFQQTFTGLVPGAAYSFSIDYSGLSSTTSIAEVYVDAGSGFQLVQTLMPVANATVNGINAPPSNTVYTVTWATFSYAVVPTGTQATIRFVNRAAPGPSNTGLFIDNFNFFGQAGCPPDVAVTKTDNSPTYTPGANVTYTIVLTNNGPGPASSVPVSDPLPAGITTATWTCSATGGGACGGPDGVGAINTTANLPVGGVVTYASTMAVPQGMTGNMTNTVTAAVPTDAHPSNNTAQDIDSPMPVADLAITKVGTPKPYIAGADLTYTIVVSNLGPSAVTGALVNDALPAPVAGFGWTCVASPGATCPASGTGNLVDVPVGLPVGASATFTISGPLPPGTNVQMANTATVAPTSGTTDPVPGNNTATDLNPTGGRQADLRITKVSAPNPYVPGQPLTYTIVVTNAGPSDAPGSLVQDTWPAPFADFTWTCASNSGGASCVAPSGSGNIGVLVDLPAGSSATFTATGTVPSNLTGQVSNTASITPPPTVTDPVLGNNTATDLSPSNVTADLAIAKTQSPDPYVPGQSITYTLIVTNNGPSDAPNARVQDTPPGVVTNVTWSCAASGAGASCAVASGSGVIDAFVTLPAGTSATFTLTGIVLPSTTGILSNTATVASPAGVTDPVPGNNTSTVNSGGAPQADLAIVKTAPADPYTPGTPLTFTIVARNNGPSDALNARVQDLFPAALSGFTWTCAPSAGAAACGAASGTGQIDALVNLPVGGAVTFMASGTVPPDTTGVLTNTATAAPPIGINDPNSGNNLSSVTLGAESLADLSVTKTSTPNPYMPGTPITYTIVASNAGPSTLFGGRVHDGLPPVLQNVTWTCVASGGACPAPSGATNLDALVDIDPGGTVTFTITADVPASTRGTIVNAATIVPPPGTEDPAPTNNTGTNYNPSIPIPGPADLQITQEFPGVAPPNGLLTFRLRTRNLGGYIARNPYITGMIPPGTTFVSVTPSAGGMCNTPGNPPAPDPVTGYPIPGAATEPLRCTWPGLMKPGESHVIEFTVRVAPGTPTGQILWSCWWTWSETDDPYHANNVVDAYLFVHDGTSPIGDLSVHAGALSEGVVGTSLPTRVGERVPMRFWVTNHGPAATRGQYALILDTVNTLDVVDIKVAQGWVGPTSPQTAMWDTGVVRPGQTVALDLTVRLLTPSAVELFAQRITGSPGDPNASNERATIVLDGYAPGMAGRWVAVGNVDGAGAGEIVTGAGRGETPQVRVFTGTGADTGLRFFAYERPFAGGVQIASCDVNSDGISELITAPGQGRAPTIRLLSLVGGVVTELIAFDAFESGFRGGASVACADLDADGSAEVIVGAGPGRAPEVQVYNVGLSTVTPRATFLAYEAGFLGGVRVAAGVYPGRPGWLDAFAIATTPGPGRAAELRLFTPTGGPVAQVVVSTARNGVLPTLGDVNGDNQIDLILAPDDGRPELVRIFEIDTGMLLGNVQGGLPAFPVGIRTAVGVLDGGPGQPEIVIGNGPGGHPRVRVIHWPLAGPVQRLEILPLEIP